jgi:hypothetical protein
MKIKTAEMSTAGDLLDINLISETTQLERGAGAAGNSGTAWLAARFAGSTQSSSRTRLLRMAIHCFFP